MQTALVAGGAGFIGSHLCQSLLSDNLQVFCIDNLITGEEKNIDAFNQNPNFKFINSDITNSIDIEKVDFVFHLASPASPSNKNPKSYINHPVETLLANSLGTYKLLEFSKKNRAKFLYASSSEIYGDPLVFPQKENYWGNVNPVGVRSVYDEGKRFGEAMTMAFFRKHDLDTRIIRIFNTYGPKMPQDGRVVTNFINQALANEPITVYGDGKQTRSFCFVYDMVEGIKKAMFSPNTKGEVINLGNPEELEVLSIAKLVKEMTNSHSEIVFEDLPEDDPKRRSPDITKAKSLLGWIPKVDIKEGLRKTIDYRPI
ncbi:MAG TPA: UDP-glucuronic acid decarboxylase family protein [Patescibacteria group bacterium]|nr:UDP-glucuronic acid decarboxylase family protein [Patescibacteria group bacterium]